MWNLWLWPNHYFPPAKDDQFATNSANPPLLPRYFSSMLFITGSTMWGCCQMLHWLGNLTTNKAGPGLTIAFNLQLQTICLEKDDFSENRLLTCLSWYFLLLLLLLITNLSVWKRFMTHMAGDSRKDLALMRLLSEMAPPLRTWFICDVVLRPCCFCNSFTPFLFPGWRGMYFGRWLCSLSCFAFSTAQVRLGFTSESYSKGRSEIRDYSLYNWAWSHNLTIQSFVFNLAWTMFKV